MYLGACTKGSTAAKSYRSQYYSDIPAKSRAFSLKQSYMTYLLNYYVLNDIETYESIIENNKSDLDFESTIINLIDSHVGESEENLYRIFEVPKAKNSNNLLIMRMLGVKTDNAEEFEKANIQTKTIRVNKKGDLREHMSFPAFNIANFTNETWEDSSIYNLFSETKFLFVVFQEDDNGEYRLKGAKLWNMPVSDLDKKGKKEWKNYQKKFISGINFTIRETKSGYRVLNDLPKASKTEMFHIRPHTSQTAYKIDGVHYGKGSEVNMDLLPDGNKMTIQSFWLNKQYIKAQIIELIN